MANDPRLLLAGQGLDVGNVFNNALMNIQRSDAISQNRAMQPLKNRLMQAKVQAVPTQNQVLQQREIDRLNSTADLAEFMVPMVESGDISGARQMLLKRGEQLQAAMDRGEPVDVTETTEALQLLDRDPALLVQRSKQVIDARNRLRQTGANQPGVEVFAPRTDPTTGQVFIPGFDKASRTAFRQDVPGAAGLTPQEKLDKKIQEAGGKAQAVADVQLETAPTITGLKKGREEAVKAGTKAFERLENASSTIGLYDEAIAAIDSGADTGAIASRLPTFRAASKKLDNIRKRIGLGVVGAATFGALSEKELEFAIDTGLPDKMNQDDLRVWLQNKKVAQQKLINNLTEAANFLSSGENTIADFIQLKRAQEVGQGNSQTQGQQGQIMIDANGNRAMVFPDGSFEEIN